MLTRNSFSAVNYAITLNLMGERQVDILELYARRFICQVSNITFFVSYFVKNMKWKFQPLPILKLVLDVVFFTDLKPLFRFVTFKAQCLRKVLPRKINELHGQCPFPFPSQRGTCY